MVTQYGAIFRHTVTDYQSRKFWERQRKSICCELVLNHVVRIGSMSEVLSHRVFINTVERSMPHRADHMSRVSTLLYAPSLVGRLAIPQSCPAMPSLLYVPIQSVQYIKQIF